MTSQKAFTGRQEERLTLEELFNSNKSEFLALYGRRRVGKTFLIRNFVKKKSCCFFNSTGILNEPLARQLIEFTKEISRTFFHGTELKERKNWFDTFELLTDAINKQIPKNKKVILFFDEFPWMATARSRLLQALDYYWNRHWSQDNRIKLIVCGSAASWIIRNIVDNKGGLHNRLTRTILLEPMSLRETKDMLHNMGVKLNNKHISQIYMVTGGVPFYLSHVTPGLSTSQVIEKLAFSKNSLLLTEFDKLYSSLFHDASTYVELVRVIASNRYGIHQEELFNRIKSLSKGGFIVRKLKELEDAGFIICFKPYKHKKKGIYYKVIDEYSLFYFHWIEPIQETLLKKGLRKGYWDKMMKSHSWYSWAGYSFEALCYKHLNLISESLNLSPTAIPNTWRFSPRKGSKEEGAQIDLLFNRDDDAITVCEIKYTNLPFAIDKEYAAKLNKKLKVFRNKTRTQKQLFLGIISANGIKETMYSEEMVDGVVTLKDLFMKA